MQDSIDLFQAIVYKCILCNIAVLLLACTECEEYYQPVHCMLLILQVRSHYAAGRYQDAQSASAAAKLLNTIGFVIGTIIMVIVFLFTFFTVVFSVVLPLALGD